MYNDPLPSLNLPQPPPPATQALHLPGDIIKSIKKSLRSTDAGANADTIDDFVNLVKFNLIHLNDTIRLFFDLIYRGFVPHKVHCYLVGY